MDSQRQSGTAPMAARRLPHRRARSHAERDAMTVEIGFALVSGGLLAGAVFLALASPALFGNASSGWIQYAQWAGGSVFVGRVLWVLLRWPGRQPSQPGRTSPDS
ncbi:DUF6332 family protein [Streptomyces sp. N2-109]|uniref:DUF6332 family protein n=1 Tax=Streptomyces gossypii TaxID=2883101 RepID=A0ABT2JU08_9ACTN|nr:DUF6332 family protein [Streptomyces gossypii]MCT2591353.1 DUF6332 family protein [Streptomyces gossypii]